MQTERNFVSKIRYHHCIDRVCHFPTTCCMKKYLSSKFNYLDFKVEDWNQTGTKMQNIRITSNWDRKACVMCRIDCSISLPSPNFHFRHKINLKISLCVYHHTLQWSAQKPCTIRKKRPGKETEKSILHMTYFFIFWFEVILIFYILVPVVDFKIEIVKFPCHTFFHTAYHRGAIITIYTMVKADFRNKIAFNCHQCFTAKRRTQTLTLLKNREVVFRLQVSVAPRFLKLPWDIQGKLPSKNTHLITPFHFADFVSQPRHRVFRKIVALSHPSES